MRCSCGRAIAPAAATSSSSAPRCSTVTTNTCTTLAILTRSKCCPGTRAASSDVFVLADHRERRRAVRRRRRRSAPTLNNWKGTRVEDAHRLGAGAGARRARSGGRAPDRDQGESPGPAQRKSVTSETAPPILFSRDITLDRDFLLSLLSWAASSPTSTSSSATVLGRNAHLHGAAAHRRLDDGAARHCDRPRDRGLRWTPAGNASVVAIAAHPTPRSPTSCAEACRRWCSPKTPLTFTAST